MNPYLEIARLHLTREDLEKLLAEKMGEPKDLTAKQERIAYYRELFTNR